MLAKRFFYVCAGILCLALAYHFGAKSATAQSGAISIANTNSIAEWVGLVGRTIYSAYNDHSGHINMRWTSPPIPGTAQVVSIQDAGGDFLAVLDNGDCYWRDRGNPVGWQLAGNLLTGSPVNAESPTWGQLKSRYRPEGTAKQDK